MKKVAIITAAMLVAASASGAYAHGKHHRTHVTGHNTTPGMTTGAATKSTAKPMGNNDELKGNSATSAGGSNSLANTNNPGGMGNNAGPPMK